MAFLHGIRLKKEHGQHFLKDASIVVAITEHVDLNNAHVLEIGCGDGFLTNAILRHSIAHLWSFEIDKEWAHLIAKRYAADKRLTVICQDILTVNMNELKNHAPFTMLANLPYNITFPILHLLQKNHTLFKEGVIMIQEEVAQKLIKTSGKDYGFISLYFQHFFEWTLLNKVPPTAFNPPPNVNSRLIYFKPKKIIEPIVHENEFWQFVKLVFKQPRRTLRNNLLSTKYQATMISKEILDLRAQQMNMQDFLDLWICMHQKND